MISLIFLFMVIALMLFVYQGVRHKDIVAWGLASLTAAIMVSQGMLQSLFK